MNKFLTLTGLTYFWSKVKDYIDTALTGKVSVVEGKGLSTEDYTTAEKEKLAGLDNVTITEITNAEIDALFTA